MNDFESLGQEFWRVSGLIGQIYVRLEDKQITEETMSLIAGTLGETQQLCDELAYGYQSSKQNAYTRIYSLSVE